MPLPLPSSHSIPDQAQWRDGRRGQDGWGRYTRRRKWYRDAELVESTPSTETTPVPTPRADPLQPTSPDPNHLTRLSSNTSTTSSRDPTLVPSEYAASIDRKSVV